MSKCSYCKKYHDPEVGIHECSEDKEVKIKTTIIVKKWDGNKFVKDDDMSREDIGTPGEPINQNCTSFEVMKRHKSQCRQCERFENEECPLDLEATIEDERWDEPIKIGVPKDGDGNCEEFKEIPQVAELEEGDGQPLETGEA